MTALEHEMRELTLQEVGFVAGGHAGPHPDPTPNPDPGSKTKKSKMSKAQKLFNKIRKAQAKFDAFCEAPRNEEDCDDVS